MESPSLFVDRVSQSPRKDVIKMKLKKKPYYFHHSSMDPLNPKQEVLV